MKAIKIFFIFVVLILVALLAFVATFDANNYKPQIIAQVEKATGRDFSIDGEINLSIFPWIGLKVEDVSLGNEKGFSAEKFASIEQLDVKVNVLPLLKKEVQINTIRLHGLDVSLEIAGNQSNNWSSLVKAEQVPVEESAGATTGVTAEGETVSPLASLQVEGFEFVDATIRYDDRSSNTKATVSALNLTTSAILFDADIDVSFGARIVSNQPAIDTRLKLDTKLVFNKEFTRFNLRDFVFTILAEANEFIAQEEKIEIRSDIDVSMDEQSVVLKQLQISALGTETRVAITVSRFLEVPVIQGSIEVEPFDARAVARRAGVELPVMAKADALSQVALKTKIKLRGEKLEANDFKLTLDGSALTGWLRVPNMSKQQVRYDLAFDQLNINDYMPPVPVPASGQTTSTTANAAPVQPVTTGDEKIELPVEMMRKLDIKGDFRIAALTAEQYKIKQFLMSLKAQQGKIMIKPLSMQVLEGSVDAAVNVNVQKQSPAYGINLKVDQVQVGPVANPFLEGVQGDKPLKMAGAANVVMAINTAGDTVNQLKKASKGQIVFDMKRTQVDGFDPAYYMRKSIADYINSKGMGLSETIMGKYKPREVTVFDRIHSTVKLADGKARTDDFLMDSKRVKITAKGYADIIQNALDVTSSIQLPRSKTVLEKIFDEPMFVRIHGPFDALEYELDKDKLKKSTTDVLKKQAKAKLDAEKQKLKVKAKAEKKRVKKKAKKKVKKKADKAKEKLKNKLKGLF
ncbi:MAG TPA: AsmA family protein [Gammaproteobacteria bacterium]|nr:AsmA family protein [Gammaproteobacteria bacterium]